MMQNALGELEPIWFVPEDQVDEYEKVGAKHVIGVSGQMPMKTKQLNAALEYGKDYDVIVTMDDDFQSCKRVVVVDGKNKAESITLQTLIQEMIEKFYSSPYMLGGFEANTNLMWKTVEQQTTGMILGQILFHKSNEIRFDESLDFLEDLDFVIQHHFKYNGIFRYNYYAVNYHIFGRSEKTDLKYSGGYEGHRKIEKQQSILRYIEKKYNSEYVKFSENTEIGKSVTRNIKWKKITEKPNKSLEEFF
jgi:hypothetical protein